MPSKSEKNRRNLILEDLRKKGTEEFESSLPLSRELFENLFDHLDTELSKGCDHTLKLTIDFLSRNGVHDAAETIDWLTERGGHCDCEVLANVEDCFDN